MAFGAVVGAPSPGPPPERRRRIVLLRRLGIAFRAGATAVAVAVLLVILGFVALLALEAWPAIHTLGFSVFTNPLYAAVPAIVGTLLTSALALLFAVPVALGVAVFAAEVAPRWVRGPLAYVVDLGAAIPSVVYGFWALVVVVPLMAQHVEPALSRATGGRVPFAGPTLGADFLTASVVLAIMIIPTISALAREALVRVPQSQREAALGLGATRWEASRIAVFGPATPGILGAILLGLGRAIGETIAVALVIGNIPLVPTSLFSPGVTIPTLLVNNYGATYGISENVLVELGLILFGLSFAVNLGARLLIRRLEERAGRGSRRTTRRVGRHFAARPQGAELRDPTTPPGWWATRVEARRSRRLRWRKAVHLTMVVLLVGAVALAIWPLYGLFSTAVHEGGPAVVRPSFYTSEPPPVCIKVNCTLGGIGPEIQGTLILLALASLIAIPVGILTAIYLSEYGRGRFARTLQLLVDVMAGIPSILLGVFVYAFFVRYDHIDAVSALAGATALALLMLPIVTRATEIALRSVSAAVRESGLALGFPRHRVTLRLVLGNCRGAIVTGNLLALSRAGGETAALVLTAGTSTFWFTNLHEPIAALGPFIYYSLTTTSGPNWTTDAWGAALVLLLIMLVVSLAARLALREDGSGPV